MILAIDPSSQCTGWALATGPGPRGLVDAGRIRPKRSASAAEKLEAILGGVDALLTEHAPELVLIETTTGKVAGRHRGSGAGLAVYGMAVGAVYGLVLARGWPLRAVRENEWTRGRPKATRTQVISAEYAGAYDPSADPGGDVADAIGILDWWWVERRVAAHGR